MTAATFPSRSRYVRGILTANAVGIAGVFRRIANPCRPVRFRYPPPELSTGCKVPSRRSENLSAKFATFLFRARSVPGGFGAKLLPVILAMLASPASADSLFGDADWVVETPSSITIYVDLGGSINDYAARIAEIPQKEIRILGTCESSCTMFLGMDHVCVADTAVIGFHGPSSDKHGDDPVYMRALAYKIAALYPVEIRTRFLDDWSRTQRMAWFTGADVRAMMAGLSECK